MALLRGVRPLSIPCSRPMSVAVHGKSNVAASAQKNVDASGEKLRMPDGREAIEWNGQQYPVAWRGEIQEDFSIKQLNQWIKEGKWDSRKNQPVYLLPNNAEKWKIMQTFSVMQGDKLQQDKGLYAKQYKFGLFFLTFWCVVIAFRNLYLVAVPDDIRLKYKHRKVGGDEHH